MESELSQHPLHGQTILLVEDNEDEIFMMRRAFRKANIQSPLQALINGEEALEYLEGIGKYADRAEFPFPLVMFLDLNMPKKGGLEVLQYIRQHATLRKLVTYILTSSSRPGDIEEAAQRGANAYFIKPAQIEKFQELIQDWYRVARFEAYPQISPSGIRP